MGGTIRRGGRDIFLNIRTIFFLNIWQLNGLSIFFFRKTHRLHLVFHGGNVQPPGWALLHDISRVRRSEPQNFPPRLWAWPFVSWINDGLTKLGKLEASGAPGKIQVEKGVGCFARFSRWWQLTYFYFHPANWRKMNPFWRAYFSTGLKPPTSFSSV